MKYLPTRFDAGGKQHLLTDNQWIASLMQKYYTVLFDYGTKFTRDEDQIKDCIQEIFIGLWQRRDTAHEILNPKFYFLRMLKNNILKSLDSLHHTHTRDWKPELYEFFHEFSIETTIVSHEVSLENSIRLKTVLSSLSKREKEVVYLKYYQFLDNAQIAELMCITRQSVYNLLHNSIQQLRTCWKKEFMD